ncbi:MAG: hypothetical protein IJQ43_06830 [Oscillospiraceae bacterium]|nr:hypothetical protein [Oscillospiraceae bacterium]
MADKKFYSPAGPVTDAAVTADQKSAERFDKVLVGSLGVYYRDGFRIKYVPYSALERAFIRVQEVNGRLCCGKAVFAYFRLVLVVGGREWGDVISEDEKAMDDALAAIARRSPATAIGFVK